MNKIDTHKLTLLLNYDSNHKKVLSWEQRVLVHQLISRNLAPNPKRVYLPIPTKTFNYLLAIIGFIEFKELDESVQSNYSIHEST